MNMYRVLYAVRCEKGFAATGPIPTFVLALLGSCKLKIANHKCEICYFFNSVINNSRFDIHCSLGQIHMRFSSFYRILF